MVLQLRRWLPHRPLVLAPYSVLKELHSSILSSSPKGAEKNQKPHPMERVKIADNATQMQGLQ